MLDSGAEEPGFKSQPRRCRVTVLGKLFTPIVPLFNKRGVEGKTGGVRGEKGEERNGKGRGERGRGGNCRPGGK